MTPNGDYDYCTMPPFYAAVEPRITEWSLDDAYDYDYIKAPECERCYGDGVDPYCDGLMPCPVC